MQEFLALMEAFPFLGDTAVALIVVILILTGKLVPRRALIDVRQERNDWRDAYMAEAKVSAEIRRQNAELLEVAKISEHLLTSFKHHQSGQV